MRINSIVTDDETQRLFPDIHFTCSGSIIQWIFAANFLSTDVYTELQLWRALDKTTFIKHSFSSIDTVSMDTSQVGLYEYTPDPPLEFQAGDMLGLFQHEENIVHLLKHNGPLNYRQEATTALTEVIKSSVQLDQNDYPLVSVKISESERNPFQLISIASWGTLDIGCY